MMLKGYRVDDGYAAGRGWQAKENAVDGLVRVFEGMKDDFGVGDVLEAKVGACHDAKRSGRRRLGIAVRSPARRNPLPVLTGPPELRHDLDSSFCWLCVEQPSGFSVWNPHRLRSQVFMWFRFILRTVAFGGFGSTGQQAPAYNLTGEPELFKLVTGTTSLSTSNGKWFAPVICHIHGLD